MQRWSDRLALAALLALGLAYHLCLIGEGIGLIDEGHLANAARRLAGGEILYRDVYTVYPPASFHVAAWLFELFGTSLFVTRGLHLAMTLLLAALVYVAGRSWMPAPFAFLAGALVAATGWSVVAEGSHYACLYGAIPMAALIVLGRADRRAEGEARAGAASRSEPATGLASDSSLGPGPATDARPLAPGALVSVGALAGLALAFRLEPFVGLALAGGVVVLVRAGLGVDAVRQLAWLVVGTLLVAVPIGVFYAVHGALGELFRAVFWTSFGQYLQGGEFNLPMPPIEGWPEDASRRALRRMFISWEFRLPVLLYAGAIAELLLAGWRSRARRATPGATAWPARIPTGTLQRAALALFGSVLYLRATGRSDYYHLAPILFPAYLLGADALARIWSRWVPPRRLALAWPLVVVLLASSLFVHEFDRPLRHAIASARGETDAVPVVPGGPRLERAHQLDDLVRDVRARTREGEPILVLPWYPIVYFLAERPNPTRFDWLFPGYLKTEAEVAAYLDAIDRSAVRVVVYSPISIDDRDDRSLAAFAPEIDRFLRRRFEPVKRYGRFWILVRRSADADA
ncbi:MAG: hypothetical protein U0900_07235 [Myxococcota bacterium]